MERLSPQSLLNAAGLNGQNQDSSPTQQHGSIAVDGQTSRDLSVMRDKLVSQTPRETDQNLLAWLESSLGVVSRPLESFRYPQTGGYYRVIDGFDIRGVTPENRRQALEAVQAAMTKPTQMQAEEWIGGLSTVAVPRSQGDDASEVALTLYCARLGQYPADILKQACLDFALRRVKPNWFPTLSEMDEACEKLTMKRQKLLDALEGGI